MILTYIISYTRSDLDLRHPDVLVGQVAEEVLPVEGRLRSSSNDNANANTDTTDTTTTTTTTNNQIYNDNSTNNNS